MNNLFDNRYYRINKFYMSNLGVWPEQSLFLRCLMPFVYTLILFSVIVPELIRVRDVSGNIDRVIEAAPPLMVMAMSLLKLYSGSINIEKMGKVITRISHDWEFFKDAPSVEILQKYAERGRFITLAYSTYIFTSMSLYLVLPVMPVILDFFLPLNETRPKKALFEAEYGVDFEEYFVPITAHSYLTTVATIVILVVVDTMYFVNVEHACALFKIVGINLKLTIDKRESNPDRDFKTICYCMNLHKDALSFADLVESNYCIVLAGVMFLGLVVMSISGVLTVIKLDDTEDMLRFLTFLIAQIISLYLLSVPGQKLIDHSLDVHTMVYEFEWYNMPAKLQKLVVPMLLRSSKPCTLTAGKVYLMSMENYSAIIQTAMSYFTVFSSMR